MSYKCEIIADSFSPQGNRLTTFLVTYPRIIHAEMLRHRMFSRNTASSRAIPFAKMVKDVIENPFIPITWQKDHKGMQGTEYFTDDLSVQFARSNWLTARDNAVKGAMSLHSTENGYGSVTKQLCNRLLEPFVWTTELITTSEEGLMNFFDLRCPRYTFNHEYDDTKTTAVYKSWKDVIYRNDGVENWTLLQKFNINQSQAEIHIQRIAEMMWDAYNESKPKQLKSGEWHIPDLGHSWGKEQLSKINDMNKFLDFFQFGECVHKVSEDILKLKLKISTAHCAKISYNNFGKGVDYEADIKLHDRLLIQGHMSPFEHCAKAMSDEEYASYVKGKLMVDSDDGYYTIEGPSMDEKLEGGWCRNFKGFIQYRHLIEK